MQLVPLKVSFLQTVFEWPWGHPLGDVSQIAGKPFLLVVIMGFVASVNPSAMVVASPSLIIIVVLPCNRSGP